MSLLASDHGRVSRSTYAFAFAAALVFLYTGAFLLPGTSFQATGDQMLFFSRALRIVHGQVLYRDFFELVTPGTDLLYAAIFRFVGVHAWVLQAIAVVVGLAFCCLLTRIATMIVRGPLVLLPAVLFLVFDFHSALDLTHHWYSTLAALAAVGVLVEGASTRRIVIASSLCGVATLFTQTAGLLTFIAVAAYLLWLRRAEDRRRSSLTHLAAILLPFTLLVGGVLGYYVHKAGFHTVFFDLVIFPPKFLSGEVNSPRTYLHQIPVLHTAGDLFRLLPVLFIYALVPYAYLFGFIRLRRTRAAMSPLIRQRLVLLHFVGLGLFLSVISGPRLFRLSTVAPPAILICTWLLSEQGRAARIARTLLCGVAVVFAVALPVRRQNQWHAALDLPIGRTAFRDPQAFREFQWLAQHSHPREAFFNSPALALYLALHNPTASEFTNDDEASRPEQVAEVLQSLQRDSPHYVVLHPIPADLPAAHDHSIPFRQYVHDHYHLAGTFVNGAGYEEQMWELDSDPGSPKSGQQNIN